MAKFKFPKFNDYRSISEEKFLFRSSIASVYHYDSFQIEEYRNLLKSLQPSERVMIHDIYGNLQETTVVKVTDEYIFVESLTYIISLTTGFSDIWKGTKAKFEKQTGCLFYKQTDSDYRLIPLGFDVKDFEERYKLLRGISTVSWPLLSTDQLQKTYHFLEELSKQESER